MIHVKNTDEGYSVSAEGTMMGLNDEVAGIIEEFVANAYKEGAKRGGNAFGIFFAQMEYASILNLSVERIKESLGFDLLDTEVAFPKSVKKPNPFTMGMSGEAFMQFMKDMKGEV